MRKPFPLYSLLFLLFLPGCNKVDQKTPQLEARQNGTAAIFVSREEEKRYVAELLAFRGEKDSFFRSSPNSPIKKGERGTFRGLEYYEPDPKFVVQAALLRNENPPPVTITTTTGSNRKAIKFGHLEFTLLGRTHHLSVFKFTDQRKETGKGYLFVPFTDSTSGEETYGAGRYIDLEENETGEYILDFNRAYNPYCAYNEDYSCPIPPRENRLTISITAGERIYH